MKTPPVTPEDWAGPLGQFLTLVLRSIGHEQKLQWHVPAERHAPSLGAEDQRTVKLTSVFVGLQHRANRLITAAPVGARTKAVATEHFRRISMERTMTAVRRGLGWAFLFSLLLSTTAFAQKAQKTDTDVSQAETAKFEAEVRKMINRSGEGLTVYTLDNGTKVSDLEGRFQSVALAKKDNQGTVSTHHLRKHS
jgi:hypothetical protein